MKRLRISGISQWTLLILAAILVLFRCIAVPDHQLGWDVFGYYLYLPAAFIYGDVALSDPAWLDQLMITYEPSSTLYQLVDGSGDSRVIKYTMGSAILMLPFFLIAHALALVLGTPDGLSLPYQLILSAGGMVYALIGLIYFRRILLEFFSEKLTALLLLLIVLGTNYFQLVSFDGTLLSHNFLFTLYAILIWWTIKWHRKPSWRSSIWIGISLGLIVVIRPSELPAAIIPILWGICDISSFKAKIKLAADNWKMLLAAIGCSILVAIPQLLYWKYTSGQWIFYSYQNAGEGFRFFPPYTLQFLLSFRKGWFVYTPLMVLAVVGLLKLRTYQKEVSLAIIWTFIFSLWIMSSWSTWWYAGGSFSSRTMMPLYVVLAIPLGFVIKDLNNRGRAKRVFLAAGLGFVLVLNVFQTWQWRNGIIDRERMTSAHYFSILGRTTLPEEARDLLLVERSLDGTDLFSDSKYYKRIVLYKSDFRTDEHPDGMNLGPENPYSPGVDMPFTDVSEKDHVWIEATARILLPAGYNGGSPSIVMHLDHNGEAYKYQNRSLPEDSIRTGGQIQLTMNYLTPEIRDPQDRMKIYVWQPDSISLIIQTLSIEMLEPKDPEQ